MFNPMNIHFVDLLCVQNVTPGKSCFSFTNFCTQKNEVTSQQNIDLSQVCTNISGVAL